MVPPEYGGRAAVGKYGEPGVSTPPYTALSPETSWSLTASVIAGQPRMRLGKPQRENRVSYPARTEQALTTDLPSKPAAVRLYSDAGQCNVLALDFDAKDRTTEQIADVAYDVFQTEAMLDQAGAWFLTDHAHGGSHVYVLLEQPLAFLEARELVEAMAQRWATLDPSPHQSIARGCITVPGSVHKLGGHRQLAISERSLRERVDGLRTPARAVRRLRLTFRDEIRLVQAKRAATAAAEPHSTPVVYEAGAGRVMGQKYLSLALEGDWAAYGYDSPSEARWAVLWSAMATGLSREDVAARMSDGRWPGLWALHAHRPHPWRSFAGDWTRMEPLFRAKNEAQGDSVHTSDTSAISHTGEPSVRDTHGMIRTWRSLLHEVETREFPGAHGWTRRLLLRAIAKQSHEIGSTLTATGIRGLSLATGLSIQTVAILLRELSTQDDPWITLTRAPTAVTPPPTSSASPTATQPQPRPCAGSAERPTPSAPSSSASGPPQPSPTKRSSTAMAPPPRPSRPAPDSLAPPSPTPSPPSPAGTSSTETRPRATGSPATTQISNASPSGSAPPMPA